MSETSLPRPAAKSLLFSPIQLRGLTARNRIVISPMCQYRSVAGGPTDWHLVHLGKFAMAGAAIVFGDETAVEERGRKTHDCAGIYDDRHIAQYRRITDFIRSLGSIPAIQLGHSGRKASSHGAMQNWAPLTAANSTADRPPWIGIAPSAIPVSPDAHTPAAMSLSDIATVLNAWTEAARRALQAGFDICEIHGAHGYLIHQFLSPVTNHRTDAYGGDRAGRMRFALEVAEAVRSAWPADLPVFFRCSVVDGKGGIWDVDDSVALATALKQIGIDVIDCSSGGIQGDSAFPLIPRVPGYHVAYASHIRSTAKIKTMAVGLIVDPHHADSILQAGDADLIAIAREALADSNWPVHAAAALNEDGYGLLPSDYAYRLHGRNRTISAYPAGTDVTIPFTAARHEPYTWFDSGEGSRPSLNKI
ncbi:NADH:flavin oxidoreductase/NADH oxidase [Bradyrhizobium sp. NP1]|uniref:NADH:flavin oxidoreductase/NADH oxidase n=1 Tax=Bradyrhizobium sp. NP1 TaxID=3049772 RepID=UPI0025A5AA42|nr:NADH:flavin oxidoreductase/NADH oxidase [Bradyrhizobium sp. NP1]WJR79148.1 NADH:flavin oxidoreductase/NADH oxidase [Bradyrhizobium sp. NP1]